MLRQAVHSGADLDAAVRAVMGYDAVSMKGKKIRVEPVAAVATTELGALLDAALEARAAVVRKHGTPSSCREYHGFGQSCAHRCFEAVSGACHTAGHHEHHPSLRIVDQNIQDRHVYEADGKRS